MQSTVSASELNVSGINPVSDVEDNNVLCKLNDYLFIKILKFVAQTKY